MSEAYDDIARLPEQEIIRLQQSALVQQIEYVAVNSAYYTRLFKIHQIDPWSIQTIEDLKKIPFTNKEDIWKYHKDFICVDKAKIIDYPATSGTSGKPVIIPQSDKDLDRLARNEANSLTIAGGSEHDIFQLTTTINKQFMAGLAYFMGIRKIGAGVIRVGPGTLPMQWQSIMELNPTVLIVVPSFLVKMLDYALSNSIDYRKSTVKKAVCIGEAIRNQDFSLNALGKRISDQWDIKLFSTYASTEMATAFTECEAGHGGHHQPDLIITELVDSQGNLVPDGEPGELVITTLGIEAFPLVRFKTGDICVKHSQKCLCGRNTYRLGPVIGRKNQMIKYKGTTLYPAALFEILDGLLWIEAYKVEVRSDTNDCDDIVVIINETNQENLAQLSQEFEAKLRVKPKIDLKPVADLVKTIFPNGSRKPAKFSDLRLPKV